MVVLAMKITEIEPPSGLSGKIERTFDYPEQLFATERAQELFAPYATSEMLRKRKMLEGKGLRNSIQFVKGYQLANGELYYVVQNDEGLKILYKLNPISIISNSRLYLARISDTEILINRQTAYKNCQENRKAFAKLDEVVTRLSKI
jgi:hypothetical protein